MSDDRMKTQRNTCKGCGRVNELATQVGEFGKDDGPKPGMLSICFQCGHLAMFCDDLSLRDLTDEEMYDVAGDPQVLHVQRVRAEQYARMLLHREKRDGDS